MYTSIHAKHKKDVRKFFNAGIKLSLDNIGDLDSLMEKRTKYLPLNLMRDDERIINDFLYKLPSGRYRSLKYKTAWGKDCFLRHMIFALQELI